MSSSIQLAGTNFSRAVTSLTLPDRRDVVGEFILGTNQAASIVNVANPSAPASVIGGAAVTYTSHGAIVVNNSGGANGAGFNTGITPYYDHTLIVVRKAITPGADLMPIVVGLATDGSALVHGLAQYVSSDYTFYGSTLANVAQGASKATVGGVFFQAGVFQQGAKSTLYGYTGGVIASSQSAAVHNMSQMAPYQIGNVAWASPQSCEVSYVAIINRVLSSAEVDAAGQSLKAYFARLGVTVV